MLVAQNSLGPVCPVPLTVRGKRDEVCFAGGVLEPPEDVSVIASADVDGGSVDVDRRFKRSAAHARIAYALAGTVQSATSDAGASESSAATTLAARRSNRFGAIVNYISTSFRRLFSMQHAYE